MCHPCNTLCKELANGVLVAQCLVSSSPQSEPLYVLGARVDVEFSRYQKDWRERYPENRDWVCFKVLIYMYMYMYVHCTSTCMNRVYYDTCTSHE